MNVESSYNRAISAVDFNRRVLMEGGIKLRSTTVLAANTKGYPRRYHPISCMDISLEENIATAAKYNFFRVIECIPAASSFANIFKMYEQHRRVLAVFNVCVMYRYHTALNA